MGGNEVYKYRWVVLACSTLTCVLTWGIAYSVGIYYVRWVEYFEAGKADVAIVGGINTGTTCLLGPIFDILTHRFGFRAAGAFGGFMMVVGLLGSAFSSSISILCVFYGFLVGGGAGLSYFAASVAVNCYFTKQRSLAEGIATMGSGLGGFAFSAFGQYLINTYDWRGAMAITGALCAHLIVFFQIMITPSYLQRFPKLRQWKSGKDSSRPPRKHGGSVNIGKDELARRETNYQSEVVISPVDESVVDRAKHKNRWFVQSVILFKNPVFLLIITAEFFCWLAIYVPYIHLPERARLLGVDLNTISWIAASLSLACTVGRPTISAVPDAFNVDVFYLYGMVNCVCGILSIISPLLTTTPGLFIYAVLYGFAGASVPLVRATAAKLIGEEAFPLAYSWIIFVNGAALYIGPAIAGLLYDVTLSYDSSFYATGSSLLVSGLLPLFKNTALRVQRRREAVTKNGKSSSQITQ